MDPQQTPHLSHWKHTLIAIAGGALLLFVLNAMVAQYRGYGLIDTFSGEKSTISVTGKGEVMATPDQIKIHVSVERSGSSEANAIKLASPVAIALATFLGTSGIPAADIEADTISAQAMDECDDYYNYNYPACLPYDRLLAAYSAIQSTTITLRDLSKIETLMSGIEKSGAAISSMSYIFSNEEALRSQAEAAAIKDARTKADALAKSLGVRVIRLARFNDPGDEGSYGYGYEWDNTYIEGQTFSPQYDITGKLVPPIKELPISAEVWIEYEVR